MCVCVMDVHTQVDHVCGQVWSLIRISSASSSSSTAPVELDLRNVITENQYSQTTLDDDNDDDGLLAAVGTLEEGARELPGRPGICTCLVRGVHVL